MEEILEKSRLLYNTGHQIKEDCYNLVELLKNQSSPILRGYYSAATMVSSKYIMNPFKKMGVFNTGKDQLEDIISENFDEVELRYLRYTIQMNIPKLLGYYRNIEMDRRVLKDFLIQYSETDLGKHILFYLKDTKDIIVQELGI